MSTTTIAQEPSRSASEDGLGRELGLVARQVRYEQRGFWRNRRRAMASFAFPLMFLLVFGSLEHNSHLKDG